jgi:hypothetical protein
MVEAPPGVCVCGWVFSVDGWYPCSSDIDCVVVVVVVVVSVDQSSWFFLFVLVIRQIELKGGHVVVHGHVLVVVVADVAVLTVATAAVGI